MMKFVATRVIQAAATLLLTSVVVFVLGRTSGNPADLVLARDAPESERRAYIQRMGLDQPLITQYQRFLRDALQGDFGKSIRTGAPATRLVFERLSRTLALATVSLAVMIVVSKPATLARPIKYALTSPTTAIPKTNHRMTFEREMDKHKWGC